jgi:hypothetical protein
MVELITDAMEVALGRPRRFQNGPNQFEGLPLRELNELLNDWEVRAAREASGGGSAAVSVTGSRFD